MPGADHGAVVHNLYQSREFNEGQSENNRYDAKHKSADLIRLPDTYRSDDPSRYCSLKGHYRVPSSLMIGAQLELWVICPDSRR